MDRKLRKRLIGATVLSAILVIVVPEWLDGAGHQARNAQQIEIPDRPVIKPIEEYMEPRKTAETINKLIKPEESRIHAWALQLGSFSQEKNALVMRDELRAQGYASYVDVLKKPGKTSYRVRIGPELDQKRLQALKAEVLKKQKIKAIVVQHP